MYLMLHEQNLQSTVQHDEVSDIFTHVLIAVDDVFSSHAWSLDGSVREGRLADQVVELSLELCTLSGGTLDVEIELLHDESLAQVRLVRRVDAVQAVPQLLVMPGLWQPM